MSKACLNVLKRVVLEKRGAPLLLWHASQKKHVAQNAQNPYIYLISIQRTAACATGV